MNGIIILLLAGICQGSFGIGYKKYSPYSWEAFWGIYSAFCFIIPLLWTWLVQPDFAAFLFSNGKKLLVPVLCGFLWGISAVGFSKAITYIGVSMVYGLSMGVSAVVGSLVPLFTGKELPSKQSVLFLLVGTAITLIGIFVITKAGILKDKLQSESATAGKNTKLGIALAVLSGLGSGAMNIGFDYSAEIGSALTSAGADFISVSAVQWLPVLFGGFIAGSGWCAVSMSRHGTWGDYVKKGSLKRIGILLLTCAVWFTALAAYGIAAQLLGELGSVTGWILFNALALLISNGWGLATGEWKNSGRAKVILLSGDALLVLSWIFIAFV